MQQGAHLIPRHVMLVRNRRAYPCRSLFHRFPRFLYPSGQFLELFRIPCDNLRHALLPFDWSVFQYLPNIRFPVEEFPPYVRATLYTQVYIIFFIFA